MTYITNVRKKVRKELKDEEINHNNFTNGFRSNSHC